MAYFGVTLGMVCICGLKSTRKNKVGLSLANKPYRRGLVVGKFSPLHKGHEYLIETASQHCKELVIISYSRPEFPSSPLAIRGSWLKGFTPKSTVLCIDAPTVEQWRVDSAWRLAMPLNSDSDELHREFCYKLLSEKLRLNVDAVFTSESYGEGFARYLSHPETGFGHHVQHVCVDINRIAVPISGTAIRNTNHLPKNKINPKIRQDYQTQKICFLGGESTGKSTLSSQLAKQYDEPLVDEYGRTLWENNHGLLTPSDLVRICEVQTENEAKAQLSADKYIFCDTSPLTTLCYSVALFNQRPDIIEAFAEQPYHHIFLCEPDFPLVQDGTRKDEEFRMWQHNWYIEELRKRKMPFTQLKGSLEQRLLLVKSTIKNPRSKDLVIEDPDYANFKK